MRRERLFGVLLLIILLSILSPVLYSQAPEKVSFSYSGQVSSWGQYSPDPENSFRLGGRYIPQINLETPLNRRAKIDFELSANIFGDIALYSTSPNSTDGKIKPYRAWTRYSTQNMEIRAGLQKINFGSAQILRPLMWFDSMDARDPLLLTDGVWGGLFRYYFNNNANVWVWALYGNKNRKGWEITPSSTHFPELGARVQLPLNFGEVALSYNFREAERIQGVYEHLYPENKIGFDIRLDRTIGIWFEGSWTTTGIDIGDFKNQEIFTLGGDYTFGIGNGLGITLEQLLYSFDKKAFNFKNVYTFTAMMLTYPLTIFDDLSTILYYDWKEQNIYTLLNWQHHFKHLSLYTILYWNPDRSISLLPLQSGMTHFSGKGVQIMLTWNY